MSCLGVLVSRATTPSTLQRSSSGKFPYWGWSPSKGPLVVEKSDLTISLDHTQGLQDLPAIRR